MPPKARVGRPAESAEPKLGFRLSQKAGERLTELQDSVEAADRPRPSQRFVVSALILAMEKRGEDLWRDVLKRHESDA